MTFKISQKLLESALRSIVSIVPSKASIPILEHVLFELSGNSLRITATDLEQTVTRHLPVEGEESGAYTFPAKKLVEIVKLLPNVTVSLSVRNNKMTLQTASGEYKIAGGDKDEFPVVNANPCDVEFEVLPEDFRKNAEKVIFAVSTDELRPALTGVLLESDGNEFKMVATDSHRLAKVTTQAVHSERFKAVVPARTIKYVADTLTNAATVKIAIGKDMIRFNIDEITIYSKVIAAQYPDYIRVIPTDCDRVVSNIDTAELLGTIRRAEVSADDITKRVKMKIANDAITVTAETEGMQSQESLTVQYNNDNGEVVIGCNAEYLLDIFKHIGAEGLEMQFKDANSAMIFKPAAEQNGIDTLMLLMPIRVE